MTVAATVIASGDSSLKAIGYTTLCSIKLDLYDTLIGNKQLREDRTADTEYSTETQKYNPLTKFLVIYDFRQCDEYAFNDLAFPSRTFGGGND